MKSDQPSLRVSRFSNFVWLFCFMGSDTFLLTLSELRPAHYMLNFAKILTHVHGVQVRLPVVVFEEEIYSTKLYLSAGRAPGFLNDFTEILMAGKLTDPWHLVPYYGGAVRGVYPTIHPITNTH